MTPIEATILIGIAAGLGALAAAGARPEPRKVPVRAKPRPGREQG